mmetsp:Transcript_10734/g.29487  ORF Transcript_10734/g.29487 Transcript_10734/m.29487 type:complete len:86 (+) Transcript_10734:856-1113(+)
MSKDATGDVMGCARDAVAGWQRFALGCKSPGHCVNDVNIAGAGEGSQNCIAQSMIYYCICSQQTSVASMLKTYRRQMQPSASMQT